MPYTEEERFKDLENLRKLIEGKEIEMYSEEFAQELSYQMRDNDEEAHELLSDKRVMIWVIDHLSEMKINVVDLYKAMCEYGKYVVNSTSVLVHMVLAAAHDELKFIWSNLSINQKVDLYDYEHVRRAMRNSFECFDGEDNQMIKKMYDKLDMVI